MRSTRYQAAIIRDHQILLLQQLDQVHDRRYWLLPGGRREPGETEVQCVQREIWEETGLHVQVVELLLDETGITGRSYQRRKTYRCAVLGGEAHPGYEPEADLAGFAFTAVQWCDLRHPATWDALVVANPLTYSLLQRIQALLGYPVAGQPGEPP